MLRLKNLSAAIIYFVGAHAFDVMYAIVSRMYDYFAAMAIMFIALASVSVVMVLFHARIKNSTGWDVLGLDRLNGLTDENIKQGEVGRRLIRWCMRRRLTIVVFGSCLIGPPVVTVLLRRPGCRLDNVVYILSGTLLSVVTWVTVWKGFWNVWSAYIKPAIFIG